MPGIVRAFLRPSENLTHAQPPFSDVAPCGYILTASHWVQAFLSKISQFIFTFPVDSPSHNANISPTKRNSIGARQMSDYIDFINSNRDKVSFKVIYSIDDKTLKSSFFRLSNVFCDGVNYYVGDDFVSVAFKNKRDCRKFLSQIRGKMRLSSTDNSMGFTRLIYEVILK